MSTSFVGENLIKTKTAGTKWNRNTANCLVSIEKYL